MGVLSRLHQHVAAEHRVMKTASARHPPWECSAQLHHCVATVGQPRWQSLPSPHALTHMAAGDGVVVLASARHLPWECSADCTSTWRQTVEW